MTAQNMGKKILSEAGYDVVAVSNGAAAVKKIAEQKPDIIILDVYMPGYTGLEVCEKVRGSLETLKTPVLLTVGKMEPYKPEDANRVKADGVIIKPFEASDLLAIVKKFEERIGNEPPPPLVKPPVVERFQEEEAMAAPAEMQIEQRSSSKSMQPMVEVPDHMASSAAFGDMLGSEPASSTPHFAVNTPSAAFETSVIVPAPPVPVTDFAPPSMSEEISASVVAEPAAQAPGIEAPAMEETQALEMPDTETPIEAIPVQPSAEAFTPELDASPEVVVTPVEAAPEPAAEQPAPEAVAVQAGPAVEAAHPQFIPVFQEPEPPAAEYAFIPTAAPPVSDVEIQREPALQETAEETTRSTRADLVEPGLIATTIEQPEHAFTPVAEPAAAAPEIAASSMAETSAPASDSPQPFTEAAPEVTDADFEARVAAAMAAYSHASPETSATEPAAQPANSLASTDLYEVPGLEQPQSHDAAAVPSFEYQPASEYQPARAEAPMADASAADSSPEESAPAVAEAVAANVQAAIPEAAAADTGADHHTIAQAVHRVMERLKPELVEEIMKELKSKK